MITNTGADIFDETKLLHYKSLYDEKGSDGYLEIKNITAGIYNIRNDGIKADDYTGTLTVKYYIATYDLVSQSTTPPSDEISELHTASRTGFKTVDRNNVKNTLNFSIAKIGGGGGTKEKWLAKPIQNTALIQEKGSPSAAYNDWFVTNDALTQSDSSGYYLVLNGEAYESCKPTASHKFLLKSLHSSTPDILVKRLNIEKGLNEEELNISVVFCGSDTPIEIKIKPNHY